MTPFIPTEQPKQPKQPCTSPEHNPPMNLYLEPGTYTWECPVCGERFTFTVQSITC